MFKAVIFDMDGVMVDDFAEDAENGVVAAKNAGMRCIGFKDLRFNLPDDLSQADLVVNNLEDKRIFEFLHIAL